MKRTTTTELAHRVNGGIEVALLWNPTNDAVFVSVADSGSRDSFTLEVDGADALEAFYHPYAYASHLGVRFAAPGREPAYGLPVR